MGPKDGVDGRSSTPKGRPSTRLGNGEEGGSMVLPSSMKGVSRGRERLEGPHGDVCGWCDWGLPH